MPLCEAGHKRFVPGGLGVLRLDNMTTDKAMKVFTDFYRTAIELGIVQFMDSEGNAWLRYEYEGDPYYKLVHERVNVQTMLYGM